MWSHEGHDLRKGPTVSLRRTAFVCLNCRVWGEAPTSWIWDEPSWTDEDYESNIEWIEGESNDQR